MRNLYTAHILTVGPSITREQGIKQPCRDRDHLTRQWNTGATGNRQMREVLTRSPRRTYRAFVRIRGFQHGSLVPGDALFSYDFPLELINCWRWSQRGFPLRAGELSSPGRANPSRTDEKACSAFACPTAPLRKRRLGGKPTKKGCFARRLHARKL